MGYNSRLSGQFQIHPPLNAAELRVNSDLTSHDSNTVYIPVEKQRVNTDNGYTVILEGRVVIPVTIEPFKAYSLIEDIGNIINSFPGHKFTGVIYIYGEEQGDIWRIRMVEGKPMMERPTLTWPDGEEQEIGR